MAQIPCDCGGKLHSGKSTYTSEGGVIATRNVPHWECDSCDFKQHDLDEVHKTEEIAGLFGRVRRFGRRGKR